MECGCLYVPPQALVNKALSVLLGGLIHYASQINGGFGHSSERGLETQCVDGLGVGSEVHSLEKSQHSGLI